MPEETLVTASAGLAAAKRAARDRRPQCVDLYYAAALLAWKQLEYGDEAALPIYQESLAGMLTAASRYDCLDPRGHLTIATAHGGRVIPISYYGFAWRPGDFCQVLPAADHFDRDLQHHYHTPGIGASLVAVRRTPCEEAYFRRLQPFPLTAVLRPSLGEAVLEFYNPLLFDSLPVGPNAVRMDRDLTASMAYLKEQSPRKYVQGFLDPGEKDVKPKLVMIEPYQPGKIPVVFIHGLGSDPLTWADAVNTLRAQGDIYRRYQFWHFCYPTGGDLLASAAALREKLLIMRETHDPHHADPALEQMVLVGHSMGGLIAQLQVSYSYDILWQHAARQPLEAVRTAPAMREQLRQNFFFDPSPLVKRAVFMATPHHGSNMARRFIGLAASQIVQYPAEEEAAYAKLMDDNRDIFAEFLWNSKPTTIDLLEPDNPMLKAMAQMPIGRHVRLHSIIGDRATTLSGEASDGVVSVSSARYPGVVSERFVSARHERVNKVDEAICELARILREHAAGGSFNMSLEPVVGQAMAP